MFYSSLDFYKKGLDPNHILNKDVLTQQGKLFLKGSPIIFIVLHCCTITHGYGEPFNMLNLLLEKGVDLEKRFPHGGGLQMFWSMPVKMQKIF